MQARKIQDKIKDINQIRFKLQQVRSEQLKIKQLGRKQLTPIQLQQLQVKQAKNNQLLIQLTRLMNKKRSEINSNPLVLDNKMSAIKRKLPQVKRDTKETSKSSTNYSVIAIVVAAIAGTAVLCLLAFKWRKPKDVWSYEEATVHMLNI